MTDLIRRLDEISELQGRQTIDPMMIEGFGPGHPPAPAWKPIAEEYLDDAEDPEVEQSPLLEAARPRDLAPAPVSPVPEAPVQPPVDLIVAGKQAAFKGHGVELTEAEERSVTRVVLRALQRTVREQMGQIKALDPKRVRRSVSVSEVPVPAPRKRGRPRKVKP